MAFLNVDEILASGANIEDVATWNVRRWCSLKSDLLTISLSGKDFVQNGFKVGVLEAANFGVWKVKDLSNINNVDFSGWEKTEENVSGGSGSNEIPIAGNNFRLLKVPPISSPDIEVGDIAEGGIYMHPTENYLVKGDLKCIDVTGNLELLTKWEVFGSFKKI